MILGECEINNVEREVAVLTLSTYKGACVLQCFGGCLEQVLKMPALSAAAVLQCLMCMVLP